MSDPAVEAAQRARDRGGYLVAAAREALQPVKDELDRLAEATKPPCSFETWVNEFEAAVDRISAYCYPEVAE